MVLAAFTLAACETTTVVPQPTAGSRADASVTLSYTSGLFAPTAPDWDAAQSSANSRCRAWGYSRADAFEGVSRICNARNGYGDCLEEVISRTYQCLGRG